MERKNCKVRVFLTKMLKILLTPISRIRKLTRKSKIRLIKIAVCVIAIISSIITVIFLYRLVTAVFYIHKEPQFLQIMGTPLSRIDLRIVNQIRNLPKDDDYILDHDDERISMLTTGSGCKIPLSVINYGRLLENKTKENSNSNTCGKRGVYLRKVGDDKVIARIKIPILTKYYANNMTLTGCCYQFILKSIQYPHEKPHLTFSNCTKFTDNSIITLQSDFINIECSARNTDNTSYVIYDDRYAFSKKLNICKPYTKPCKRKYNVLMIGIDSMSLPRLYGTMTRTARFLNNDHWFRFPGYNKIEDKTLPNLMAVLTGKNISEIRQKCAYQMDECNDYMIWNAFKEIGYITAYGEDYLQLPDTFTKQYQFHLPPTDHYVRPFFLKGETKVQNSSVLCAGKALCGKQLLDYAIDFANTYKKDSFFGLFWINSFSHDDNSKPEDADKILENFFNQLSYTGILVNTFIILFSGHGIRFGTHRIKMESYYDDRLPMFCLWVPLYFRGNRAYEVRAMGENQSRLTTPYDLYSTLLDIRRMSMCIDSTDVPTSEACPNCHSLFQLIKENRTCHDVSIHEKWCTCHKLYPLPVQDLVGRKSVNNVVRHIQNMTTVIQTQNCWGCKTVSLKQIHRIHFYYGNDKNSLFYVVAFTLMPGNVTFEATVLRTTRKTYEIMGPISVISSYKGLGNCALNRRDRPFCICQKKQNC